MSVEDPDGHRQLRELLGSHALGDLPPDLTSAVQAHLDGCASCRAELTEIAELSAELSLIDPDRLIGLPTPPAGLGQRIRAAVAEERELVDARRARVARRQARASVRRRLLGAAAAVAVLSTGLGLGTLLARESGPAGPPAATPGFPAASPAATVKFEQLALEAVGASSLQIKQAGLIPHTWGVEVRFTGTGFAAGEVFRAAFRTRDGQLQPAGEFLGTGAKSLVCNLQAALLRPDATGFVVMDAAGTPVLTTDL